MPYNETAYKASQKYKAGNIKRVPLDMQKSVYEEIKAHAEAHSESVNGFIKRAIQETMERDTGVAGPSEGHTEGINAAQADKLEGKECFTWRYQRRKSGTRSPTASPGARMSA